MAIAPHQHLQTQAEFCEADDRSKFSVVRMTLVRSHLYKIKMAMNIDRLYTPNLGVHTRVTEHATH